MKKLTLLAIASACALTSCREQKNYYYTPTIGVEVQGGDASGVGNAPLQISDTKYEIYRGNPYMGDEGVSSSRHYTPYSERDHNYNYYRGSEE